ncbi:MAG: GspH/FimT family pseudopilin [Burkholderiales bacterium]|jgi:type IV fimbrial biogenesis protein FimT|nr:GspH/FimT family pseudopilin [Burkholderiales bacterium]
MSRSYSRGFTLIELMVVLVLIAGTLTMAAPAFGDWLAKSRQRNLASAIDNTIALARTEAIKRNGRVIICISADQQTCTQSGGWEQGWLVYFDPDNSRTLNVNEPIIHHESGGSFSRLSAPGNKSVKSYLSFVGNGKPKLLGGGLQAGTIFVCAPGQNEIRVVMAATGRTRTEHTSTPCPP